MKTIIAERLGLQDVIGGLEVKNHVDIGKISRVDLRKVWENEAYDLTAWLEENIGYVNDLIGTDLTVVDREHSAGSFFVDLVCSDRDEKTVIIENQLGKSDHDHLGKLITYLAALEAKAAIWIVPEARPEHANAVTWLNESGLASFYLIKLEAIQIDDSKPAPLFTVLVGPSDEIRAVGTTKKVTAEQVSVRHEFWEGFLAFASSHTKMLENLSPTGSTYLMTGARLSYLYYSFAVGKNGVSIELYIDSSSAEQNKRYFDQLFSDKAAIELEFGERLEWMRLDNKKASRIRKLLALGCYKDPADKWPQCYLEMIETMIRLERVFAPRIRNLRK